MQTNDDSAQTQQAELISIGGSSDSSISPAASTMPARRTSRQPAKPRADRIPGDPSRKGCLQWPRALIDLCRTAYLAGATLAALSVQHGIPYDTLSSYSKREDWPGMLAEVTIKARSTLTDGEARELIEQRSRQVKRGIGLGARLQDSILARLESGPVDPEQALALMQLATAADKSAGIVRRELAMDAEGGGKGNVSQFAIHAANVNLSL